MLLKFVVIYLAVLNVVAFVAYGIDKYKAKHNRWRISEATLLLMAIAGGSVGALLGMRAFRHKTQKQKFTITIPLVLVLQIAALLYLTTI
ncbi:MAG: DUF1294 domain-containing protein [Muribaculaceae bacterium]|nr:DUF1294 domain-containing protein [Muribaculaceae bacterium]